MNQTEMDIEKKLRIMEVVEKELNYHKYESNLCLTVFLIIAATWMILIQVWNEAGRPIEPKRMTIGVEIIAIIMLVFILSKTRFKIRHMGISTKNLKSSLIRSVLISAVLALLMIGAKLILKPGEPLIDMSLFNLSYSVTSVFQEFLARGFLVTCLMNIYESRHRKHLAVLVSSLLFTMLHQFYGFKFMMGAEVLSILLGYVYLKDENIWGVSIIHFVFGTLGTMLTLV